MIHMMLKFNDGELRWCSGPAFGVAFYLELTEFYEADGEKCKTCRAHVEKRMIAMTVYDLANM